MAPLALVTGGSGYFGTVLVDHLLDHGYTVRIFDVVAPHVFRPGVGFLRGDIRDATLVRTACEGVDVVFHNVAQVPLARHAELFVSVNVGGTATLLDACREQRVGKVVHTSSSAIFGIPLSNPVTESTPPRPAEEYGEAKLRGEMLCRSAAEGGLDVTVIRPRTILGLGRLGIMSVIFDWVADGANVYVLGRGDNLYQFVHAADLADACRRAAERPGPAVYNVGAAEFGSMLQTLQALIDHAGTGSRVRSVAVLPATMLMRLLGSLRIAPLAPYHWLLYGQSLYFDITKAKSELGWQPRYSNTEMIIESYENFMAHRFDTAAEGGSRHRSAVKQGALRLIKWLP
jgi:nucleoside-diphosphate-sugar epimerase